MFIRNRVLKGNGGGKKNVKVGLKWTSEVHHIRQPKINSFDMLSTEALTLIFEMSDVKHSETMRDIQNQYFLQDAWIDCVT